LIFDALLRRCKGGRCCEVTGAVAPSPSESFSASRRSRDERDRSIPYLSFLPSKERYLEVFSDAPSDVGLEVDAALLWKATPPPSMSPSVGWAGGKASEASSSKAMGFCDKSGERAKRPKPMFLPCRGDET